jgi:hypothetical protein
MVHAVAPGDRPAALAGGEPLQGLGLLVVVELGLAAHVCATALRCLPALLASLQDAETLILEGCDQIYREKASGRSTKDRPQLEKAIDMLGTGD